MEKHTRIKCKCFYLRPSTECLENMPEVQYFDVLDPEHKLIDTFDYIRLSDPRLATDLRDGEFRIFPWLSKNMLIYDEEEHQIYIETSTSETCNKTQLCEK